MNDFTLTSQLYNLVNDNGFNPQKGDIIYVWTDTASPLAVEFFAKEDGRYLCKVNEYAFCSYPYAAPLELSKKIKLVTEEEVNNLHCKSEWTMSDVRSAFILFENYKFDQVFIKQ